LKQNKVVHGAYHFYLAAHTAQGQADAFLRVFGDPHPLRMAPIVDIEELSFAGQTQNKSVAQLQADVLVLLDLLQQATGRTPILYTNADVGNIYLNDPRFSDYPLWVADWTSREQPTLPEAWRDVGYRFWQRANTYTLLENVNAPVDMDIFRGEASELVAPGS